MTFIYTEGNKMSIYIPDLHPLSDGIQMGVFYILPRNALRRSFHCFCKMRSICQVVNALISLCLSVTFKSISVPPEEMRDNEVVSVVNWGIRCGLLKFKNNRNTGRSAL